MKKMILLMALLCATMLTAADKGIGIVFVPMRSDAPPGLPVRPSLPFYAAADTEDFIGSLVYRSAEGQPGLFKYGAWLLQSERLRVDQLNLLEFDYEYQGLPIDSVSADLNWVRGLLGYDENGSVVRVWVHVVKGQAEFFTWEQHLPRQSMLIAGDAGVILHKAPAGSMLDIDLSTDPEKADCLFRPIRNEGQWLQVRVCLTDHDGMEKTVADSVWIQYLDDRARPLVFYPTRGH